MCHVKMNRIGRIIGNALGANQIGHVTSSYGWNRRKNKFPVVGGMVRFMFVPSSEMPPLVDQFVVVKSEFCCKVQFVQDDGHDTFTLLLEGLIVSVGTLIKTESVLSCSFAQIKSILPSPFISAATSDCGLRPTL